MAIRTPIKAIRAKCLDCTNNQFVEIKECKIQKCPLWEYRMGHRPPKDVAGLSSSLTIVDEEFTAEDISE